MAGVQIADIAPFPEGMNLQDKPWAIPEGQARYLQDIILHEDRFAPRRGPVTEAFTIASDLTKSGIGIVGTFTPSETFKLGVLNGTSTSGDAKLSILSAAHDAWDSHVAIDESGVAEFLTTKRHHLSTSGHPNYGLMIGTSDGLKRDTQQNLFAWAGAGKAKYTTGTITVAQDSTSVTGSGTFWNTNAEPGMYLYAHIDEKVAGSQKAFIGVVASIEGSTALTLVDGALWAVTGRAYYLRSTKPIEPRVAKGTITCNTGARRVTGENTKFKRQRLDVPQNSGVYGIFRADDMKYVGKVESVASDIQLTLVADALINCNKDKYVAIDCYSERDSVLTQTNDPGFLNARFANRTWYANRGKHGKQTPQPWSRIFFSDILDPEAIDTTADGDHFHVPSSKLPLKPITALATSPSCLVVAKQDETYGVFGDSPENFQLKKINPEDGAISNMTVQYYEDGVVYTGMKGIWFWDGQEAFNLIDDRIGDFYRSSLETLDPSETSAWSLMYKGNYIVHIEGATPYIGPVPNNDNSENPQPAPGQTLGEPQDHLTICVNLERRAVSFLTNLGLRGSIETPFEETLGTMYLVNKCNTTTPWAVVGARICSASDLFYEEGLDTIFTQTPDGANNALGPDLYMESKRYDINDPQMKKRFKQLQMNYHLKSVSGAFIANGYAGAGVADYDDNYLRFATMVGLNNVGVESNSRWRLTRAKDENGDWITGFQNKRIKFNKRSQHVGFRIWQSNITGIQAVRIGPMALGWRPMRPGRV